MLLTAVTWQVQSDYFGTVNTVSEPRSLRGLALSADGQNLYAGFIQGTTSAAIREVSSGINAPLIGNDGGSPTNSYGANPPYTTGIEAKVTTFNQPKGLATDDRGYVYATLNTSSASTTLQWAIYNSTLTAQVSLETSTDFISTSNLQTLATAKIGGHYFVYIGWKNGQIERWNVDNPSLPVLDTSWGSSAHPGTVSLKTFNANSYIDGLTVDTDGTIYVAGGILNTTSFGDALIKVPAAAAASGNLSSTTSVAVGNSASTYAAMDVALFGQKAYVTQYLAANSQIAVFNESDLSSAGTISLPNPAGPSGLSATFSTGPDSGFSDIDISSSGKIYVAEQLYNAVAATGNYTPPGGVPMTGTMIDFDRVMVSSALDAAPVIDSVTITPTNPTTNQTLTANVTSHDPDGDTVTYSYQWFKNGVMLSGQTASTFDLSAPGNGDKGDSITVTVTPNDGVLIGAPVTSAPVTVADTAPIITSVSISPSAPTTNQTLTANVVSEDDDGDSVTYTFQWYKNNSPIGGANGNTLDLSVAGNGDKGDSISVQVTPSDGTLSGAPVTSSPVVVADSAPVVDSVTISPSAPTTNQTLTANVTSHDDDGDPVTYGYQWFKNSSPIGGANGNTLDLSVAGNGDKGDSISVQVTPSDGTLSGAPVTSSPVVVADSAPIINSVTISPSAPTTNQTLTANVTSHDDDGDPVSYSYQWYKNNSPIGSANGNTLDLSVAGNGDKGDSITVQVTPSDGTLSGAPVTSSAMTVVDSAPVIDSVSITPTNPGATSTLMANLTSHDDDGDAVTFTYQWYKDNSAISSTNTPTLNLGAQNAKSGDMFAVKVTPSDGTLTGAPVTSAAVTVFQPSAIFSNLSAPTIVLHTRKLSLIGTVSGSVAGKLPPSPVTITVLYASGPLTGQTIASTTATFGKKGNFTGKFTPTSWPIGAYTIRYSVGGNATYAATSATTSAAVTYGITDPAQNTTNGALTGHTNSTIALALKLVDAANKNVSSASIAVTATGIALASSPNSIQPLPPGNGTGAFTYSSVGAGTYTLTFHTTAMAKGTYLLYLTVSGDPIQHSLELIIG